MSAARTLASILFILAIPAALITTNVRFMVNEPRVYTYAIDDFGAVATTGVPRPELIRAMGELRDYFNAGGEETVAIRVPLQGREQNLFNPRETGHLKDVKARFNLQNRLQEFSVLYVIGYIAAVVLWSREVTVRSLAIKTMLGSGLTLILIGAMGAVGASGFTGAWTDFHEIIFSNDLWLLNPRTDRLIQIFPTEFWQNIVFFVGVMSAAQAALALVVSGLYVGATGRRRTEGEFAPSYG